MVSSECPDELQARNNHSHPGLQHEFVDFSYSYLFYPVITEQSQYFGFEVTGNHNIISVFP